MPLPIYAVKDPNFHDTITSCQLFISTLRELRTLFTMDYVAQLALHGLIGDVIRRKSSFRINKSGRDSICKPGLANFLSDFHKALISTMSGLVENYKMLEEDLKQQVLDGVITEKKRTEMIRKFGANCLLCQLNVMSRFWTLGVHNLVKVWYYSTPDKKKVMQLKLKGLKKVTIDDLPPKTVQGYTAYCAKLEEELKAEESWDDYHETWREFGKLCRRAAQNNPLEVADLYCKSVKDTLSSLSHAARLTYTASQCLYAGRHFQLGAFGKSDELTDLPMENWSQFHLRFHSSLDEWDKIGIPKPWYCPNSMEAMDTAIKQKRHNQIQALQKEFWGEITAETPPTPPTVSTPKGNSDTETDPEEETPPWQKQKNRKQTIIESKFERRPREAKTKRKASAKAKATMKEATMNEMKFSTTTHCSKEFLPETTVTTDPEESGGVNLKPAPKVAKKKPGPKPKPKPPSWRTLKDVKDKQMVSWQELKKKGEETRQDDPKAPIIIYFHCPYCDHARQLSSNDILAPRPSKASEVARLFPNGMADIRLSNPNPETPMGPAPPLEGAMPVDQELEEERPRLRVFVAHGKMRTHVIACYKEKRCKDNPEALEDLEKDPILIEEKLPPVFRSDKRKYSRTLTYKEGTKGPQHYYSKLYREKKKMKTEPKTDPGVVDLPAAVSMDDPHTTGTI